MADRLRTDQFGYIPMFSTFPPNSMQVVLYVETEEPQSKYICRRLHDVVMTYRWALWSLCHRLVRWNILQTVYFPLDWWSKILPMKPHPSAYNFHLHTFQTVLKAFTSVNLKNLPETWKAGSFEKSFDVEIKINLLYVTWCDANTPRGPFWGNTGISAHAVEAALIMEIY